MDAVLLRLCKAYDQYGGNNPSLNLRSLLGTIKANLHLFDEPNFRERLKDRAFVDSLAADVRRPDSAQLEKDLESVGNANPLVKNLTIWRNNYYAHRSPTSALDPTGFSRENPLQFPEIEVLLANGVAIVNRYSHLFVADFVSIYSTPLSSLGSADLQKLIADGAVENVRLEFKLIVPDKDSTLKKLSSFANTFGGYMVIGAKEGGNGRLEDLPGVDLVPGYKQMVVDWCFNSASPPLVVGVSEPIPTPSGNGKFCYVIYAEESEVAPHFLNGRKGVWVRADEFSFKEALATERELRYLFDRRKLILTRRADLLARSRVRFDTYVARTHTDRSGSRTYLGPRLELCIVPRFPARPVCEQEKLKSIVMGTFEYWRQTAFPNVTKGLGVVSQHFIKHAAKMLAAFGYSGSICIQTALASIRSAQWFQFPANLPFTRLGSGLDDDVEFSITVTSEELRDRIDGVAIDVLRNVFFSVNWSDLIDTKAKAEELVRNGYSFNLWQPPKNLAT